MIEDNHIDGDNDHDDDDDDYDDDDDDADDDSSGKDGIHEAVALSGAAPYQITNSIAKVTPSSYTNTNTNIRTNTNPYPQNP